jgi:endonuclease/exonuclease/phosphatase family metal-dependent hydrolase
MHRLNPFLAIAAAATLLGCAPSSAPDALSGKPIIRLATWNLEHLAASNGTGCRPRTEADYQALRKHADRLGADVIALQEVENEAAARRVFLPDDWTVAMSKRPAGTPGGTCRENPSLNILNQDVGFAIRKGIPYTRNTDFADLAVGNPDLRWGVDITLNVPKPIRLLAIHLKSGCNSGRAENDTDCTIIFNQAEVLERWIDSRAAAGEDYAILGDWNRRTALPGDAFVASVSDDDPPGGRLIMTNAGVGARCLARYKDFIDHIAVGERTAARVVPGSFSEYRYDGSEDTHPADHCPSSVALTAR